MRSRVVGRRIQAWSPVVVLAGALTAFAASFVVYSDEAPKSDLVSRVYAAMDAFSGAYIPLGAQTAQPSEAMSRAGIFSLSITFLAAFTALWSLSRRARQWLRARRAGSELIVIGSGEAAAEILRSHQELPSKALLLIAGDSTGPAVVAVHDVAPYIVSDLDVFVNDQSLIRRARRAEKIAVATDDDVLNLTIADALTQPEEPDGAVDRENERLPRVIAVVSHPDLADELRPAVIDGALSARFGISCPTENIAEEVCHRLDELLRKSQPIRDFGGARLYIDGDGGLLARSVALWTARLSLSRACLSGFGSEPRLPILRVVDEVSADGAPVIRVMVGEHPPETAARTRRAIRSNSDQLPGCYIAVTAKQLLGDSAEAVVVIDPRQAAWHRDLVFDDIAEQWGRSYHYAYCVIFAADADWSRVHTGREGQSSIKAAQEMLRILHDHHYRLVKASQPSPREFSSDEVRSMAEREHEAWLKRDYTAEDGSTKRVAEESKCYNKPWTELDAEQQQRNEILTAQTFPAMAALFGYEIQPIESRDDGGV
jgi:hypothetical protein